MVIALSALPIEQAHAAHLKSHFEVTFGEEDVTSTVSLHCFLFDFSKFCQPSFVFLNTVHQQGQSHFSPPFFALAHHSSDICREKKVGHPHTAARCSLEDIFPQLVRGVVKQCLVCPLFLYFSVHH